MTQACFAQTGSQGLGSGTGGDVLRNSDPSTVAVTCSRGFAACAHSQ
jgi:hypothetical protein